MKRNRTVLAIGCLLLMIGGVELWANNGLRPWNHGVNPAFFSFGNRQYAELGASADFAFGNSAFALSDLFSRVLVIDLDEVYENTPNDGLRIGATGAVETHLAVQVGRLGLGLFSDQTQVSRTVVPRSFIGLLAKGNELDQSYDGSTQIVQRVFTQAGIFATYEAVGFVFGTKVGGFAPIVYSDGSTKANYRLETLSDGTVRGEVFASGNVYTSFGDEGFEGQGYNISLGVVKPDSHGRPLYGGAINNIPIVAARPGYAFEIEQFRFEFETDNLLDRFEEGLDPFDTDTSEGDANVRTLDSSDRPRINMPVSVSGFYRFAVPVVDVIPSAELVFDDPFRLNAAVVVEGNFFPADMLSLGFGHRNWLWYASAGLRIPLRVFELAMQVQSVGTEPRGVFNTHGLGATVSLALGY